MTQLGWVVRPYERCIGRHNETDPHERPRAQAPSAGNNNENTHTG
jgi:hypothetical protein